MRGGCVGGAGCVSSEFDPQALPVASPLIRLRNTERLVAQLIGAVVQKKEGDATS